MQDNPWEFSDATARVLLYLADGLCGNYPEDVEDCIKEAREYLNRKYPED